MFTKERRERILRAKRVGASDRTAAQVAGISSSTLQTGRSAVAKGRRTRLPEVPHRDRGGGCPPSGAGARDHLQRDVRPS